MKMYFSGKILLQTAIYLSIAALCVSFPHIFTYELGRNISLATALVILISDHYHNFTPAVAAKTGTLRDFIHRYLTLIILSSVTLFVIGALNEKLFDILPAEHNALGSLTGPLTNAGFIPKGDNAFYLLGIQSFLKYGILIENTCFRPIAHTLNAVLFKISGEDMIRFFYLTSFLLVAATTLLSRIIANLVSPGLGALASFFALLFFSRFQATFMTELSGGIIGLFAIAVLIQGFFRKNIWIFGLGMTVFALAMQIRTGAVFAAPVLVIAGAYRMGGTSWKTTTGKTALLTLCFVSGMVLPSLQMTLFEKNSAVQSNAGYFLYQIQTGSSTWKQVKIDYPNEFKSTIPNQERAHTAFRYTLQKFTEAPADFFINYFGMMIKTAVKPGDFLFHFWGLGEGATGWVLFILLVLTPWIHPENSKVKIMFWFLVAAIIGALLSSPILEEVRRRTYATTVSINALCVSLAIINALVLAGKLKTLAPQKHFLKYIKTGLTQRSVSVASDMTSDAPVKTGNSALAWLSIVIIGFIFTGPIMLDQLREPALPAAPVSDLILTDTSLQKILIAPNHSQGVFIDMEHDFLVENPKIIPKSKFNNNNLLCDTLSGGFYLYNALNLLASPDYPSGLTNIIIPQRLVGETDIKNISWMMLEGEIIYPKKVNMFITKNIIQTSQTSK
jgi:hypothetical protein